MFDYLKGFFRNYFYEEEQFAALFILIIASVLLYFVGSTITPVFVSILVAYLLNGVMNFFCRWTRCSVACAMHVARPRLTSRSSAPRGLASYTEEERASAARGTPTSFPGPRWGRPSVPWIGFSPAVPQCAWRLHAMVPWAGSWCGQQSPAPMRRHRSPGRDPGPDTATCSCAEPCRQENNRQRDNRATLLPGEWAGENDIWPRSVIAHPSKLAGDNSLGFKSKVVSPAI